MLFLLINFKFKSYGLLLTLTIQDLLMIVIFNGLKVDWLWILECFPECQAGFQAEAFLFFKIMTSKIDVQTLYLSNSFVNPKSAVWAICCGSWKIYTQHGRPKEEGGIIE